MNCRRNLNSGGEYFKNVMQAFIWPVQVITYSPPWGIAIFIGTHLLLTYLIKQPLERWLFDDED